jgi:aerobic-type carbon monoxide dehydrogenase small subunit (CoxS/CutS family)
MTATALLRANGRLDRKEIINALRGNLCHCTGYKKIAEAVEAARARLNEVGAQDVGDAK